MKKHNSRLSKWLRVRAWNQRKRERLKTKKYILTAKTKKQYHATIVQLWQGGKSEAAISTQKPRPTPNVLCFNENTDQTVSFFADLRKLMFSGLANGGGGFVYRKKPNGIARIPGYVDFSMLHDISLGAAVVLTADYNRLSNFIGEVPPTVDLHNWQASVVTRLNQLGFFSLLGHVPSTDKLIEDGPTLTMRIVQGTNADELQTVDKSLQVLGKFLRLGNERSLDPTIVRVLTTISEAITNVTQHAYTGAHVYEYRHINSFWVAATADRQSNTLTVVVYDQGATIPVTYPRLNLTARAIRFLRSAIKGKQEFAHQHDGTYIRAAMRYGGSRTDETFRGKGLPQMFKLMKTIGSGQMSIRSRGGWCVQNSVGRMTQGYADKSIGGTFVEWTFELGEAELGANDDY